MNAEQSRSKEVELPVFVLPRRLTREQAVNVFKTFYKPKGFTLTGYKYNPQTGFFAAIGYDTV